MNVLIEVQKKHACILHACKLLKLADCRLKGIKENLVQQRTERVRP